MQLADEICKLRVQIENVIAQYEMERDRLITENLILKNQIKNAKQH